MDIRNRINDITALSCHVCQAFLKMVLVPNWKEELYIATKDAVENNSYRDKYIEAYNKMRDIGLDAYDVDCMDISFISVTILYRSKIAPTQKITKDALKRITQVRNISGHFDNNESTEELYLYAQLALTDIISFIKTVDLSEVTIEDKDRHQFRSKWLKEAENLQRLIDDERIESVQVQKEISLDIKAIKESQNQLSAWIDVNKKYSNYRLDTGIPYRFWVAASDEGIVYAHILAASYFALKRNFDELFKRLTLLCSPNVPLEKSDVSGILGELNNYLALGNKETPQFKFILEYLSHNGFVIIQEKNGFYSLQKR